MVKIIYDSAVTGHHSEYIGHLVKYLVNQKSEIKYYFVVPEELKIRLPEIVEQSMDPKTIFWEFIPVKKVQKIQNLSLFKRSFSELALVQEYADKLQANEVILMYFNIFQLALCFKKPKYVITGVLFLQFYRMNKKSAVDKLKYYRKYFTTKWYTRNVAVKKIFILNDKKTVDFLNLEFNTKKFEMLEDPVPKLKPLENFNIYDHYKIDNHRNIFLHIGSLDSRKGTFEILESLTYISKNKQKEICILLVGKASSSAVEEIIITLIKNSQKENNVQVIWDNQFVNNDLMKSLFENCNVVLMPYKNTEASSGILGHAMASNKKIITTGTGLLQEIIENYTKGEILELVNPKSIAHVIETMNLANNKESDLMDKFLIEHSPENFSKKILSN